MAKDTVVFITGESGLLATYIADRLRTNESPFVLLSPKNVKDTFVNDYHFYDGKRVKENEVDITSDTFVRDIGEFIRQQKSQHDIRKSMIIHCAAYTGTDKCADAPTDATRVNVLGTQSVIDLAKMTGSFLVYFSTTATYDPASYEATGVFTENCKQDPKTLYGLTKYIGEKLVISSMDLDYVVIKPVFIYGPAPLDYASAIRRIVEKSFLVGSEVDSGNIQVKLNPDNMKDYIWIEDFVEMLYRVIISPETLIGGKHFILCRNRAKPFCYYMNQIREVMQRNFGVNHFEIPVEFLPDQDYLGNHVAYPLEFYSLFPDFDLPKDDIEANLSKVLQSVKDLRLVDA